ncbi:heparinase II/III family protein [Pelagibacterales bacterium]|nr:heparinase II/III family protein [Pelagibacterales bacterium]
MRKLIKPKVTERFQGSKPQSSKLWKHITLYEDKINNQLEACFLNHTKKLELPADWNNESPSKLWLYNLHYFEDLLSNNAEGKRNFHLQILNRWIDQNPVGNGNAWEPYPTSLRIVNILKAWLGGLELDEKLFSSVFIQASFLSNNLERHLLGNHYFVNLKALLFAGVIFENIRWLDIAEKGLIFEIPEQILDDGANFELSPMYHSLILVDMLDMLNLYRAYPTKISSQLASLLEDYIPKMLTFMEGMSHPDEGLSFFNDSVNGIAPIKAKIESYAKKLGFVISPINYCKTQIIDSAKSGYFCATVAGNKLIFDASPIGPDYIPAHAHADTLAFELSIGKQRVFVNSGISEYGVGKDRLNQRQTASHNTVEVDGKDSSKVWGSFRVANRARILGRLIEFNQDPSISLSAGHNGYKSLFGGCIHQRNLILTSNSLQVLDVLEGDFKKAIARFYIHPDLDVCLNNNILKIQSLNFSLRANTKNMSVSINDSFWHPQFGQKIPNKLIKICFASKESKILFTWKENLSQ